MRSVPQLLAATMVGVALGLGSAEVALRIDWTQSRVGDTPWTGNPRAGGVAADPYTRAYLVRTGDLLLGGGEGVTYTARTDATGARLTIACDYVVSGAPPSGRYFTLTATAPDGRLFDTPARRYGFTSLELVRGDDGGWEVAVSRAVQPGHWLPLAGEQGPFQLVLRLYDTPLAGGSGLIAPVMPTIRRGACR